MGFGTQNEWKRVIYFNLHAKKDEEPFFDVQTKEGDDYVKLPKATYVSGYVLSLAFKDEIGYENKEEKNLYLKLFDKDELYVVRIKFNMLGRSIMNSLASLETMPLNKELVIRVYRKKMENGELFSRVFVGLGGEALNWTLTPEDMKSMVEKIKVGSKVVFDTTKLDNSLFALVSPVCDYVKENNIKILGVAPELKAEAKPKPGESLSNIDDLGKEDDAVEMPRDNKKRDPKQPELEEPLPEDDLPF